MLNPIIIFYRTCLLVGTELGGPARAMVSAQFQQQKKGKKKIRRKKN
jgi:hypothetical protein